MDTSVLHMGNWIYGSVEPLPIKAPELDQIEQERQAIRAIAIQAASVLYSHRFDKEVQESAFAPVFAPPPLRRDDFKSPVNQGDAIERLFSPSSPSVSRQAPLSSPAGLDYLLQPSIWLGLSVNRPATPQPRVHAT